MKTHSEKEKKLDLALDKLKNLNLKDPNLIKNLQNLSSQKNQLEIEKKEIEDKYQSLMDEHKVLSLKLEKMNNNRINEQKKETEFSEKIDELN